MERSTRWCFTLNNYTPEEGIELGQTLETKAKYFIIGKEVSSTGTEHLQGYVILKGQQRLSAMKKINSRAHWEVAKGSTDQNIIYCSKESDYYEFGERPKSPKEKGQMEKERWAEIIKQATDGTLREENPAIYFRYRNTADKFYAERKPEAIVKNVQVFWGPTGTGKSMTAWAQAGEDAYAKDPKSKFWCGYTDEKNIIIDEFRGGIDIAHMLRWLDRYPCYVETKGSSRPLCARNVWITSNLHPREWYPDLDAATLDALLRRMHIIHYGAYKEITK